MVQSLMTYISRARVVSQAGHSSMEANLLKVVQTDLSVPLDKAESMFILNH